MFSERVAISNQHACKSIMEADEQFKKSCTMCCNSPRCLWKSCDGCRVAEMHKFVVSELKKRIEEEEV